MNHPDLELAKNFLQSQVQMAARELERLDAGIAAELLLALPVEKARLLLGHMLPAYAAEAMTHMPCATAIGLLEELKTFEIVPVLRSCRYELRRALLVEMAKPLAARCQLLLGYSESTAGGWMSPDIVMLPARITASDALHQVARSRDMGDGNALPVVDESRQLIGFVGVGDLLRARGESLISRLTRRVDSIALPAKLSLKAAARHPGWQTFDNLIVVNPREQPEGILRHVAMRQALRQFSEEATPTTEERLAGSLGKAYLGTLGALFNLFVASASPPSGGIE